ncbi:MAG: YabP/YqfC family sporulation protein [Clostridiales bacterium]|nr:YabP/YqfC family sporulation protein [Clostridiales bacterium]
MSFIEQTAKIFGNSAEFKFQAVLFGRDAFYIESARAIKIDETEMIFKAPRALIYVCGENLTVKELTDDYAAITGRIKSFTVDDL